MSKITIEQVEAAISSEHFFTAADGRDGAIENGTYVARECPMKDDADLEPLEALTFCVLVLKNGFTVHGSSKCADPTEFDPKTGRELARADAIRQVWPLMGFTLCNELAEKEQEIAQAHAGDICPDCGEPFDEDDEVDCQEFLTLDELITLAVLQGGPDWRKKVLLGAC